LFVLFINDLPDVVQSSFVTLFADDLKLCHAIKSVTDRLAMQNDINAIAEWSRDWILPLSIDKLAYLHIGFRCNSYIYWCNSIEIKTVKQVKDLGVLLNETFNFRDHLNYIRKKAHSLCYLIFKSFESREPIFLSSLFTMYVRPLLEYASPVWSPHLKCDVTLIEYVQRSFTKRIPALRNLSYVERLSYLGLPSLERRRIYLDLVLLYKIIHGHTILTLSDLGISTVSSDHNVRNRGFALKVDCVLSSLSMYSFVYRSVKVWNSLPKHVYGLSLSSFKLYIRKYVTN
jgi:hypothetical protein